MMNTPDKNTPERETRTADGAVEHESMDAARAPSEAATRFRRNARLLCAGSVNVTPFAEGADDER